MCEHDPFARWRCGRVNVNLNIFIASSVLITVCIRWLRSKWKEHLVKSNTTVSLTVTVNRLNIVPDYLLTVTVTLTVLWWLCVSCAKRGKNQYQEILCRCGEMSWTELFRWFPKWQTMISMAPKGSCQPIPADQTRSRSTNKCFPIPSPNCKK